MQWPRDVGVIVLPRRCQGVPNILESFTDITCARSGRRNEIEAVSHKANYAGNCLLNVLLFVSL